MTTSPRTTTIFTVPIGASGCSSKRSSSYRYPRIPCNFPSFLFGDENYSSNIAASNVSDAIVEDNDEGNMLGFDDIPIDNNDFFVRRERFTGFAFLPTKNWDENTVETVSSSSSMSTIPTEHLVSSKANKLPTCKSPTKGSLSSSPSSSRYRVVVANCKSRAGGLFKTVQYMFLDCTKPRGWNEKDAFDDLEEWLDVPTEDSSRHRLDIRHDNRKWHFWKDEVEHETNLTE